MIVKKTLCIKNCVLHLFNVQLLNLHCNREDIRYYKAGGFFTTSTTREVLNPQEDAPKCCCVLLLGSVRLFVIPWTVAPQALMCMGILQARTLEWVAIPSSRGSSQPRDGTQVSHIAGRFFTI